ncbi:MAG: S9 family peptidase [Propionibacteriaceae bacterium]|nr:S9 family peptidase [Propionibacteriaceae bacterium]
MLPEHIDALVSVSRPSIHPDGWAVFSASRPDTGADAYVGQVWKMGTDSDIPQRITRGFHDFDPQVSPDATLIGFLRDQPGRLPQLAIMPANGGEPMILTDQPTGVKEFHFTPDSSRIVFISGLPSQYPAAHSNNPGSGHPRRITGLAFRMDGRGWAGDQRFQVLVVEVPDLGAEPAVTGPDPRPARAQWPVIPNARQITEGDYDHTQLAARDGYVIVTSARHRGHDADLRVDLYRVSLDAVHTDPVLITSTESTALSCSSPVVCGDTVFFLARDLGRDGLDIVGTNSAVYQVSVNGGVPERITDPANTDVVDLAVDPQTRELIGVVRSRGSGVAVSVELDGRVLPLPAPSDASVREVALCGGLVVASVATTRSPGEIARLGGRSLMLTDLAETLRAAAPAYPAREMVAVSPDGAQVHGWVVLPEGEGPHPVLLVIHPGPFEACGPTFSEEAQLGAQAGYAVVMCNPRGSASYGEAHAQAIKGACGDREAVDVLAFLDHVLANVPGLDPARVGIMGAGYGGYLTAWIIAHDHRFSAAIVERACLDPRSLIGACDIGWYTVPAYHTSDPVVMDAQSPLLLADKVITPTLVMHAEDDLRCPLGQALRYYTELKMNQAKAELLVFPGESHDMPVSGRPRHRRQRLQAILDWWSRHL